MNKKIKKLLIITFAFLLFIYPQNIYASTESDNIEKSIKYLDTAYDQLVRNLCSIGYSYTLSTGNYGILSYEDLIKSFSRVTNISEKEFKKLVKSEFGKKRTTKSEMKKILLSLYDTDDIINAYLVENGKIELVSSNMKKAKASIKKLNKKSEYYKIFIDLYNTIDEAKGISVMDESKYSDYLAHIMDFCDEYKVLKSNLEFYID